jgi:polar amino acid transport system permease protein
MTRIPRLKPPLIDSIFNISFIKGKTDDHKWRHMHIQSKIDGLKRWLLSASDGQHLRWVLKMGVIFSLPVLLLVRGFHQLGYNWQWYRVSPYIVSVQSGRLQPGPLLEGLQVTFQITAVGLILSLAIGLVTAFLRLSRSIMARLLARFYLELIRNTPLLVQLFFIYFVLSPILDISRFSSAVLALSLFEGAYISEIFRAGIVSIHKGQWEAAYSLGMRTPDVYRYVILPQVIWRILPPLTGQAISLIKDSALVSTIAVYDLTMQGQVIIAETYLAFEIWFTVAAIYLLITTTLSILVNLMENRFKIKTG